MKMQDDLISRRAIFHELLVYGGKVCPDNDVDGFPITIKVRDIKKAIKNAPEVKPPERHGEWLVSGECYECSECGGGSTVNTNPYCWKCGARMDGKGSENND